MQILRIYSAPDAVLSPKNSKINKLEFLAGKGFTVWWENNNDSTGASYPLWAPASSFPLGPSPPGPWRKRSVLECWERVCWTVTQLWRRQILALKTDWLGGRRWSLFSSWPGPRGTVVHPGHHIHVRASPIQPQSRKPASKACGIWLLPHILPLLGLIFSHIISWSFQNFYF